MPRVPDFYFDCSKKAKNLNHSDTPIYGVPAPPVTLEVSCGETPPTRDTPGGRMSLIRRGKGGGEGENRTPDLGVMNPSL